MPLYELSTIGTASNSISFNDDSLPQYYRLTRRTPTRRELVEFDIKLPEQTGDTDFQSFIGKMYLILEGVMFPTDDASFDIGRRKLRKLASLDIEQADTNSDMGYVPYKWNESDGYNKQLFLKVMYVDLPETTRQGMKQPFRILCKIKYPVIFGQTAISFTLGDSAATTSGSSNLPFTLPRAIGLTTYSSNGSVTNPGDLASFPQSITVYGPMTTPRITNSTTGEYVEVNTTLATTSDSLIITYDQDSQVITQAGNSVLNLLTTSSTLFKLRAGNNNLTLTGATVGSGAYASGSVLPAWPLA